MPPPLSEELVDFVESGVSILVATRDAALRPDGLRGAGARVSSDRRAVTIMLPEVRAERALANLHDNGQIAVTFSRPSDHQGVQLKGRVTAIAKGGEPERATQERYRAALFEQLQFVGVPRAVCRRLAWWPSVAVTFEVDALFLQTPGPGAGRLVEDER